MNNLESSGIPASWKITLNQFTKFLKDCGRFSNCPVCPHRGQWRFYIDNALGTGGESYMMLTMMPVVAPDRPGEVEHYGVYTMECPNCGYALQTSARFVEKALSEFKEESNG